MRWVRNIEMDVCGCAHNDREDVTSMMVNLGCLFFPSFGSKVYY